MTNTEAKWLKEIRDNTKQLERIAKRLDAISRRLDRLDRKTEPQEYPCEFCRNSGSQKCGDCKDFGSNYEPQTENLFTDKYGDVWEWRGDAWYCISGDEPQEGQKVTDGKQ